MPGHDGGTGLSGIDRALNMSLDSQICLAHYLAPLRDLALDACAEFIWSIRHGFEPQLKKAFLNSWIGHRLGYLALQQVNDIVRRTNRRQHAG